MQHVSINNPIRFTLSLTIGVAIKLKELGILDVMKLPGDAAEFTRVISDEELFPRLLWHMTDQAIDFNTFKLMVAGSEQENLWRVFQDELVSFFLVPTWKEIVALASVANEQQSENQSRTQHAQTTNDEPNGSENLNEAGTAFGNSPESLVSILDASHTDNLSGWPMAANARNGLAQAG